MFEVILWAWLITNRLQCENAWLDSQEKCCTFLYVLQKLNKLNQVEIYNKQQTWGNLTRYRKEIIPISF